MKKTLQLYSQREDTETPIHLIHLAVTVINYKEEEDLPPPQQNLPQ